MFIVTTTPEGPAKLRQERHGDARRKRRCVRALNPTHAAPDGARRIFWRPLPIDMALLTELSRPLPVPCVLASWRLCPSCSVPRSSTAEGGCITHHLLLITDY